MATFKDARGREWILALDPWLLTQIKDRTGCLLTKWADDKWKLRIELADNPALLCDVLWCFCEEQAEKNGVKDTREFARGFGGTFETLQHAFTALDGAVADFCMNQEQKQALANLTEKSEAVSKILVAQAMEEIAALDPAQLAKNYMDSVSNSQPSPESTRLPAASPSAN